MGKYNDAYHRLLEALNDNAKHDHGNLFDAMFSYISYGVTPNEYLGWKFWNYSRRKRKQFYTARDSKKYELRFNPPQYVHYFDNKVDFNKKFSAFVSRDWIFSEDQNKQTISDFIESHEKTVIKPIDLSSGKGIHTIVSLSEYDGKPCLLEQFITQHPDLAEMNPSSVNSIRIYTILDKNQNPYILSASLRVGGKNAEVDNYHSGGVGYPIDIASGIIFLPGKGIDGTSYIFHPSTNIQMVGRHIPNWSNCKDFVFEATKVIPNARLIAWDVAVLPNGFELIEGNCNGDPGFLQAPTENGLKKEILRYL